MQDWMPVFLVKSARHTNYAAHPESPGERPKQSETRAEDFLQRVGAAIKNKDGSLSVQLDAIPLNGHFLIRPPKDGEFFDPTTRGGK